MILRCMKCGAAIAAADTKPVSSPEGARLEVVIRCKRCDCAHQVRIDMVLR